MTASNDDRLDLIKLCQVPQTPHSDRELTRGDFEVYLSILDDKIDDLESFDWSTVSTKCLTQMVILVGQHSETNVWTTEKARRVISSAFLSMLKANSNLFAEKNCYLTKNVLKELQPKLLKSNFKLNPACVVCFKWLMRTIEPCGYSEVFSQVVSTSLILVDDFESHYQAAGLNCLTLIISHSTKSNLTLFNHDIVILNAIKPLFYHCEAEVVPHLLECFLALLSKVQTGYFTDSKRIQMDDLVDVVLNNAFLETRSAVKLVYAECLPKLIEARGLGSVLHMSKIYEVLADLCVQADYMVLGLEGLEAVIKTCWMREKTVFDRSARLILKVSALLNRTNDRRLLSRERRTSLTARVQSIGRLMFGLWPDRVRELSKEIDSRTSLGYLLTGIFPV